MRIRILHISDLHMVSSGESEAAENFTQGLVFDAMVKFIRKENIRADLVVLTGDAAWKARPAQYEMCASLCDKLLAVLCLSKDRLFVAPGNHDVQRDRVTDVHRFMFGQVEKAERINMMFTDKAFFPTLLNKFENFDTFANQAMGRERFGDGNFWFCETLCARPASDGLAIDRLGWFGPAKKQESDEDSAAPDADKENGCAKDANGVLLRVAALNSCVFAGYDGDDAHKLALGINQVKPAIDDFGERENELCVGFFHHPFSCHSQADTVSKSKLTEKLDLILTGHVHDPQTAAVANEAGKCVVVGAGAMYMGVDKLNTFNLIEIDASDGSGTVQFFKYLPKFDKCMKAKDVYPHSDDGAFHFKIGKLSLKKGEETEDEKEAASPRRITVESSDVGVIGDHITVHGDINLGREKGGKDEPENRAALRESYLNRVMCDARLLTLEGVDPKAAMECTTDAALDLNSVYTALMTEHREVDMEAGLLFKKSRGGDKEGEGVEKKRVSALEFADSHQHTALLGDPGSGKTTFVKFMAMCMASELLGKKETGLALLTRPMPDEEGKDSEKPQKWGHGPLMPVWVELKEFAAKLPPDCKGGAEDLWRFIRADLQSKDEDLSDFFPALKNQFREPGGLLLLDGLDEVPEAENRRAVIKNVVADFIKGFPKSRVLVTSRSYAYQKQEWRVPELSETVLAPFDQGQILCFVDRWYARAARIKRMSEQESKGKAELLKRAILKNERLRELAERPLLLTLMASLHAWRGGSLPEQRQELYSETVDLLLDRWEERKIVTNQNGDYELIQPSLSEWLGTDKLKIREFLNELAFDAHKNQPKLVGTAQIKEEALVKGLWKLSKKPESKFDMEKLIEFLSLRAGLLIPKGVEIYTFPHRTFQEYLAACHLTDYDFPDEVAELCRKDPDRWREACLLAGAKAASGAKSAIWNLAGELCYQDHDSPEANIDDVWGAQMAARAIIETADWKNASERNRKLLEKIKNWLVRIVEGDELPAAERADAGNSLGLLGEIRPEVADVDRMLFCLVPAGPYVAGEGEGEKIDESLDCPFWIGKYPVSNGQFDAFVQDGGYKEERYWPEAAKKGFWKDGMVERFGELWDKTQDGWFPFHLRNHPANGVSWYESLAFARWLQERWVRRYAKKFTVRLALSAEWEKAAKGGTRIPEKPLVCDIEDIMGLASCDVATIENSRPGRRYPWGEDEESDSIAPEYANYNETGLHATTALGCFRRGQCRYGCVEMSGNVWEWCMDPMGSARVLRGGSWVVDAALCRAASRAGDDPSDRLRSRGFRLVLLGERRASSA